MYSYILELTTLEMFLKKPYEIIFQKYENIELIEEGTYEVSLIILNFLIK